jgi:dTDP-D-glucose 4,6-dehydratase
LHVDNSVGESLEFTRVNVIETHALLEATKQCGITRFIQMSPIDVYGNPTGETTDQQLENLTPTSPYGCTKTAAELMCHAYIRYFNLPVVIVRNVTIYGTKQFPGKLVPKLILRLQNAENAVSMATEKDFVI